MRPALFVAITLASPCIARAQSEPPQDVSSEPSPATSNSAPSAAPPPSENPATAPPIAPVHVPLRAQRYRGGPIPNGMHVIYEPRRGHLYAGIGLMSASYLALVIARSALCSPGPCTDASNWLYVPLVGPFVYVPGAANFATGAAAFVGGLAQLAGTILIVVGTTARRADLVPDSRAARRAPSRARMSWQLAPTFGAAGTGAMLHLEWL